MPSIDWITAATVVSALATVTVAIATILTLLFLRRQVRLTVEVQYDQRRPLLYPPGTVTLIDQAGNVDWSEPERRIPLENAGSGVAVNICGVLIGPRTMSKSDRYTLWQEAPLTTLEGMRPMQFRRGGAGTIPNDTTIGAYTLHAPDKPSQAELMAGAPWIVARLTVTYHDVFGRKHAALFDYTAMPAWSVVAFLEDISHDLLDLDDRNRPLWAITP